MEAQWLSGRVLDLRLRGSGFEPHWRHCVVVLEQDIYPSLVLVQPRKTSCCFTERLLMGRKESNQTNKQTNKISKVQDFGFLKTFTDTFKQKRKYDKKILEVYFENTFENDKFHAQLS